MRKKLTVDGGKMNEVVYAARIEFDGGRRAREFGRDESGVVRSDEVCTR